MYALPILVSMFRIWIVDHVSKSRGLELRKAKLILKRTDCPSKG